MQRLFYYPAFVNNLGFSKVTNTFTIEGGDARAFGLINMSNIVFPDRSSLGHSKEIQLRSNRSFIDAGGASEIIGALFGTVAGVAESATPFYVYAISNVAENEMTFFLSRQRGVNTSPVAGDIGDKNTPAIAITENAFWAIASITEADYAEKPCIMIGSIEMSKDTSDDWTVSALTAEHGVNRYPQVATSGGSLPIKTEYFKATDFDALETNFAPLTQDNGTNAKIMVRSFDDTTEEYVNFSLTAPTEIDTAGTVTFRVWMYAATAVASKNVALTFDHRPVDNSESWDQTYTSEDSGDIAIDATQDDITEATWTETISNLGWVANDIVSCRLSRPNASTNDLVGDLQILGFAVEIPRA